MVICKVCGRETLNGMAINFNEKLVWARCSCGCITQQDATKEELSEEYLASFNMKKFKEKSILYPYNVYFPIIEDLTFGRRLLEVDPLSLEMSLKAYDRGWVTYATAPKENEVENTRVINESFETVKVDSKMRFDCIYSYHNIDKAKDFRQMLKKFYFCLNPKGVLFLASPDSEYVDTLGVPNFNHWYKENNIVFSRSQIEKELEKIGFDIVMSRSNDSSRFVKNNDFHIIAVRRV